MLQVGRRGLLAGLVATVVAPAVVRAQSLMPLRGVLLDPIVRLQTWRPTTEPSGIWEVFEGPLSRAPSLLRHFAFLMEPALPNEVGGSPGDRTNPNAPLLPKGVVAAAWIGGHASGAVRADAPPSPRPRFRGEELPSASKLYGEVDEPGFGVRQIWTNRPEDQLVLGQQWEERKASTVLAVGRYQQRTEQMKQRLTELAVWGR